MALKEAELRTQKSTFKSGNEMAALAASQINFHLMGYYPITPSTEIAEYIDEMKVEGENTIAMVAGDGEHGAAGICYGAAVAGGRVFNATSANGYLYALEQMPVQAGTRMPMVLDLVTRSVSGPLDIRGDHSDLYFALNTGWIILYANNPQEVYDLHPIAVRVGEHPDVRLPVIVGFDGFFTSHQKRRVMYFEDGQVLRDFVGPQPEGFPHALDPRRPMTFGPYMNDPDLINNKYQLHVAMENARRVIPEIFAEWEKISGRRYDMVESYRMDDADVALVLLGSAADTGKQVADQLREQGVRAGVLTLHVLRPFPADEIRAALRGVSAVVIGERADSYGSGGGNLSHEIKSALKDDPDNRTLVATRIYGLGGKDFFPADAEAFYELAVEMARTGRVDVPFDYHGVTAVTENQPLEVVPPLTREEQESPVKVELVGDELKVTVPPPRQMMGMAKRITPGHGACPGCGIFPALDNFFRALSGDVVVLFQTGCAMVVTTGYPYSAHRVTYIHNLFQNGAATLSGVVEMFHEKKRRGEIEVGEDITFVMVTGDGGMDIGMGPAIGAALRNHKMIILEYDNEGYMNTGSQLSYSTPIGHKTATSNVGSLGGGKTFHHKDTPQIMAACHIPYVFTAVESQPQDLWKKAAKAQWYAKNVGLAYGKLLIACPLNWLSEERLGTKIVQAAVDCNFFPLYEVERGITRLTYDPEAKGKKIPVEEWLKMMGKTRHMMKPEFAEVLAEFQREVDRRFRRIKAMSEHPDL
ncbi:pyruvate ferredoxin oxidoreductase alpha subunit [Symbiobacterium terraclitae]|uniref:Pyruvate ferredoxin oxidoreductase alpha subunit n=1 Tax=Symbiobacterium terraclitae TaxID=557451 RepID=A0ABS4JWM2_9FIRM|nr:thiamine pyrophosphate-dependent enzyme [Symbiobacterium terraclitae]MBP2019395.1 pyruvate ferredoxin oxidoreductase alpha subunit [Symbiobacterium terraclitae]